MLSRRDALLLSIATFIEARLPSPIADDALAAAGLRDYQQRIVEQVLAHIDAGERRILVVLPTGGGKTVLASSLLGSAARHNSPAQFIVHRKELIEQTSESFSRATLPHGFIATGYDYDPGPTVTLAGVQRLVNVLGDVRLPEFVIVDEAHHATAATWEQVLTYYGDAIIVGLTATPQRLDGKGLEDHFDVMVLGPSTAELIEAGWLSRYDYYAPTRPDLSDVPSLAGDFNRHALEDVMDKPTLIGDVVDHYKRLALGQQGIVFAVSRDHSRNLAEAFQAAGVSAAHVDGAMPKRERKDVVGAFRAGDIDVMTNVELFGEGFDVPAVRYCGLARPTKSLALCLQQVGRALRPSPGKDRAIICDHAGNVFQHGLPDDPREWSLKGRVKAPRGAGNADALSIRQCDVCYRVSPSTVKVCPGCGEQFAIDNRDILTREGELSKVEREALRKREAARRVAEEKACSVYDQFRDLAVARGYRNPDGWAHMKMKFKTNYRGSSRG